MTAIVRAFGAIARDQPAAQDPKGQPANQGRNQDRGLVSPGSLPDDGEEPPKGGRQDELDPAQTNEAIKKQRHRARSAFAWPNASQSGQRRHSDSTHYQINDVQ
jgi:hypothetical protein